MPSPRENSALWHYFVLGTVTLPPDGVTGYVSVEGGIEWDNDPKKKKGTTPGRTTSHGRKAEEKLTIKLTWQEAPGAWDLVSEALSAVRNSPGPYDVAHGNTDFTNTRSVMVDKVGGPKWEDGWGELEIEAHRWTPQSAGGGAGVNSADLGVLLDSLRAEEAILFDLKSQNIQNTARIAEVEGRIAKIRDLIAQAKSGSKTPSTSTPSKTDSGSGPERPASQDP